MDQNLSVITEQGDLGLGVDPISEEDKKKLEESKKNEK